jgi:hypothetical protein
MIDPLNGTYEQNIDPIELQQTLAGFLGQTYQEISRYDSHLVSANPFLAPKKEEFHRTAERVFQEVKQASGLNPQARPLQHTVIGNPIVSQTIVQAVSQTIVEPEKDPNQLEFCFDNSVTAISIDKRLDDLEKRLKRLDSSIQKVLSLLEHDDIKDSK